MASPPPEKLNRIDRGLDMVLWAVTAWVAVTLFAGPELIGAKKDVPAAAATPVPTATATATAAAGEEEAEEPDEFGTPPPAEEPAVDGSAVFTANCGSCHTLAAAGTSGAVGPNLDDAAPDAARVSSIVQSGSGAMPSFSGQLSAEEIEAVAAFVSESAGG